MSLPSHEMNEVWPRIYVWPKGKQAECLGQRKTAGRRVSGPRKKETWHPRNRKSQQTGLGGESPKRAWRQSLLFIFFFVLRFFSSCIFLAKPTPPSRLLWAKSKPIAKKKKQKIRKEKERNVKGKQRARENSWQTEPTLLVIHRAVSWFPLLHWNFH